MITKEVFEKFLGESQFALPWKEGNAILATDAKILICLTGNHGLLYPQYRDPIKNKVWYGVINLPAKPVDLSNVVIGEKQCQCCGGSGVLEQAVCDECDGSGEVECFHCGSDIKCDTCGGTGSIHDPGPCDDCGGTGKGYGHIKIDGLMFNGNLVKKIKELPTPILCINENKNGPQMFRFNGGWGLIMPMGLI